MVEPSQQLAVRAATEIARMPGTLADKQTWLAARLAGLPEAEREACQALARAVLIAQLAPASAPLHSVLSKLAPEGPTAANLAGLVRAGVLAAEKAVVAPGQGPVKKQMVADALFELIDAAVAQPENPLTAEEGAVLKATAESSVDLVVQMMRGDPDAEIFSGRGQRRRALLFGCLQLCCGRRGAAL